MINKNHSRIEAYDVQTRRLQEATKEMNKDVQAYHSRVVEVINIDNYESIVIIEVDGNFTDTREWNFLI